MKNNKIVFFGVIFLVTILLQTAFCCFWFSQMKQYCAKACEACNTPAEVQIAEPEAEEPPAEEIVLETNQ